MIHLNLLLFLFVVAIGVNPIIPEPNEITTGTETATIDRCSIIFAGGCSSQNLKGVHEEIFPLDTLCSSKEIFNIYADAENSSDSCNDESYELIVTKDSAKLSSKCYVGLTRAYATLLFIFGIDDKSSKIMLDSLPIQVKDKPRFEYRGLLIDTARHYLKKETIKRIIEMMMYGKMNVLHWHLVDDDSFPMVSKAYPDLAKNAAFSPSMVYTKSDIREIIGYAGTRGIRIMPEIDGPGHSKSLKQYEPLKKLLACPDVVKPFNIPDVYRIHAGPGTAALDPTINETYEYLKGVLSDVDDYFIDELIHLGGDEVRDYCWDNRTSIKEYMAKHNIPNYKKLREFYIERVRKVLNEVNSKKRPVYWLSEDEFSITYNDRSVLHYWGNATNLTKVSEIYSKNSFIFSPLDYAYLDCGYENAYGMNTGCGDYRVWTKMYLFEPTNYGIKSENILGGEACAWGEVTNDDNIENKVWPRAMIYTSVFWEAKKTEIPDLIQIVKKIKVFAKHAKIMNSGISPITGEYCELKPEECFQKMKNMKS